MCIHIFYYGNPLSSSFFCGNSSAEAAEARRRENMAGVNMVLA